MHFSVLLNECIERLNIQKDQRIVDCTLGFGGHSSEILKRIPQGHLYAFDQDEKAISYSRDRLSKIAANFDIIESNFVHLKERLEEFDITSVDGILFDLGVSSPQLDEKERGFSFHQDARLDMRMNTHQALSAYEVVNTYSFEKLVHIFKVYGEEKFAVSIARKIEQVRIEKPIETTLELVEIIKSAVPEKYKRDHHPARKVFQAIRIEVNDELRVCEEGIKQALDLLNIGGRCLVITFHSLEDRICKNIFKQASSLPKELSKLPIVPEELKPKYKIVGVFRPTEEELKLNHRSRSATLRVIERIK